MVREGTYKTGSSGAESLILHGAELSSGGMEEQAVARLEIAGGVVRRG